MTRIVTGTDRCPRFRGQPPNGRKLEGPPPDVNANLESFLVFSLCARGKAYFLLMTDFFPKTDKKSFSLYPFTSSGIRLLLLLKRGRTAPNVPTIHFLHRKALLLPAALRLRNSTGSGRMANKRDYRGSRTRAVTSPRRSRRLTPVGDEIIPRRHPRPREAEERYTRKPARLTRSERPKTRVTTNTDTEGVKFSGGGFSVRFSQCSRF
jgi:hypothetical protein